jgi:hypothetical protein
MIKQSIAFNDGYRASIEIGTWCLLSVYVWTNVELWKYCLCAFCDVSQKYIPFTYWKSSKAFIFFFQLIQVIWVSSGHTGLVSKLN